MLYVQFFTYWSHVDDELHSFISHRLVSSAKLAECQTSTLLYLVHTHPAEHVPKLCTGWLRDSHMYCTTFNNVNIKYELRPLKVKANIWLHLYTYGVLILLQACMCL